MGFFGDNVNNQLLLHWLRQVLRGEDCLCGWCVSVAIFGELKAVRQNTLQQIGRNSKSRRKMTAKPALLTTAVLRLRRVS